VEFGFTIRKKPNAIFLLATILRFFAQTVHSAKFIQNLIMFIVADKFCFDLKFKTRISNATPSGDFGDPQLHKRIAIKRF
jgi:hypothetical protein